MTRLTSKEAKALARYLSNCPAPVRPRRALRKALAKLGLDVPTPTENP